MCAEIKTLKSVNSKNSAHLIQVGKSRDTRKLDVANHPFHECFRACISGEVANF